MSKPNNLPQSPIPHISISRHLGKHSVSWRAEVRMHEPSRRKGSRSQRIYIGTLSSEIGARKACEHFIRTGEKPEQAKRGPKSGPRERDIDRGIRKPRSSTPNPDRIAMMKRIWRGLQ